MEFWEGRSSHMSLLRKILERRTRLRCRLAVLPHALPAPLDDAVLEIVDHQAADAEFGGAVIPDQVNNGAVAMGEEAPPLAERHARGIDGAVRPLDQIAAVIIAIGEGAVLDRVAAHHRD